MLMLWSTQQTSGAAVSEVAQLGGQLLDRMDRRTGLTSIITKVSFLHTYIRNT